MAKPTKPKDAKPKAEGEVEAPGASGGSSGGGGGLQIIILAVIVILSTTISSAASVYFLAPMVLKPLLAELAPKAEGEGGEGEAAGEGEGGEGGEDAKPTVGPVVQLDEFTVNLKDPGGERYLRATISLSVTTEDPKFKTAKGEEAKKWEEEFHGEMSHYVPGIRDIIIDALTSKTSTELSSTIGKEKLKEEVKKQVDALFHGERQVIRVNLENFIIQ